MAAIGAIALLVVDMHGGLFAVSNASTPSILNLDRLERLYMPGSGQASSSLFGTLCTNGASYSSMMSASGSSKPVEDCNGLLTPRMIFGGGGWDGYNV